MHYEGKIKYIWPVEYIGHNQLEKRTVVLEEVADREYKGGISFDLFKDKTRLIDPYSVGDRVTAHLSFKCRYYETTDSTIETLMWIDIIASVQDVTRQCHLLERLIWRWDDMSDNYPYALSKALKGLIPTTV